MSGRVVLIGLGVGHGFGIWTRTTKGAGKDRETGNDVGVGETNSFGLWPIWSSRSGLLSSTIHFECSRRLLVSLHPCLAGPQPDVGNRSVTMSRQTQDSDLAMREGSAVVSAVAVSWTKRSIASRGHLMRDSEPRKAGELGHRRDACIVRGRGNNRDKRAALAEKARALL
jgi:hypothetical protein